MELLVNSQIIKDQVAALTVMINNIPVGLIPDQKYLFKIKGSFSLGNKNGDDYLKLRTFLGCVDVGNKTYIEVERIPCKSYLIEVEKLISITTA